MPPLDATIQAFIRDDLRLTSWLLLGACLQFLGGAFLPHRLAFLPAAMLFGFRLGRTFLMTAGLVHDTTQDEVVRGRMTVRVPDGDVRCEISEEKTKQNNESEDLDEDLVVFIIGTRSNHPLGRLAPGFLQAGDFIQGMWKVLDADEGRQKWGYLGRTTDMLATDSPAGNAIVTISYWRSKADLQGFATSAVHMEGWRWYEKVTKTYPHLGLMHEVYSLPRGRWENVYRNMTPWGMGLCRWMVSKGEDVKDGEIGAGEKKILVNGLVQAEKGRLMTEL